MANQSTEGCKLTNSQRICSTVPYDNFAIHFQRLLMTVENSVCAYPINRYLVSLKYYYNGHNKYHLWLRNTLHEL